MQKIISGRHKGVGGSWKGYCQICGEFGVLTKDHVPPKAAISLTKVEQKLMTEVYGQASELKKIKGVIGKNGSTFKTICAECNNSKAGGVNDEEVSRVYKKLHELIFQHFSNPHSISNTIAVDVDSKRFLRAMIGHILSATSAQLCREPLKRDDKDQLLRDFVLGDGLSLSENYDIYYWYYPFRRHISTRWVAFRNQGHTTAVSSLSFFPLAMLITNKNEGIYPAQARKLTLESNHIYLDITARNLEYATFPFCSLKGDQLMVFNESVCITSMPINTE
ncbi:hypothetical protein [Marinomonas spartinae]|uniref:hypothetical protein n=1 Tax=Marinomonas spartinae TaxID=1792290 RepID=UPI0018F1B37F|nr:hypothetical protein [Marinomonas spartinae]MBJ7556414.1 hypothetical protein [Marinomonas spartinae]